jgi:hypothetical protein
MAPTAKAPTVARVFRVNRLLIKVSSLVLKKNADAGKIACLQLAI